MLLLFIKAKDFIWKIQILFYIHLILFIKKVIINNDVKNL